MHFSTGGNANTAQASQQQAGAKSRKDSASYLGISTRKLDDLAARRILPRAKIDGKTVFRVVDLDKYLESCIQQAEQ